MSKHSDELYGGLLSVTEILKEAGIAVFFGDNTEAKERGTNVHLACDLDDAGNLDEATLLPEYLPYLEQWRGWKKLTGAVIEKTELRLVSQKHGFGGTIDNVLSFGGKRYLCDKKTGGNYESTAFQTAGYNILYRENFPNEKPLKRISVILNPKRKAAKVVFYKNDARNEVVFNAARLYVQSAKTDMAMLEIIQKWKEEK
jgi:hypothetical protein